MTQKELLTTLKEWQKKKEILEFDTKCLLTHDLKRSSKALSCIGVFACAAYTNRLHLYIYSEETTWLLNRRGDIKRKNICAATKCGRQNICHFIQICY